MDFDFSDDQEQLRDAVRRFVDKGYPFDRRRATEAAGGFSKAAFAELAELGLTGLCVAEEHGGMGMGPVECLVVLGELGRGIVLEPLTQNYICAPVLQAFAPTDLQVHWLPKIASGEALVTLANQERNNRYDLTACAATASASADGSAWVVSGTKTAVPAGCHAQALIVPATIDGQTALFLVRTDAPGVSLAAHRLWDGAAAAHLTMTAVSAELITRDGVAALQLATDIGVAALCAEAVGVMDKTLSITTEYMNTRKQFGVNIASFQALRHRVADMKMALELARSMSYYASLKLGAPAAERSLAMSRAKVQLGQSMRAMGTGAVQLHGGIGVTDEYIVSHYFRRLTAMELQFGDSLHHLGEVSRQMQDTAGVFA